jgi:uncharacterized protein YndB with AHSA1/START domain
MSANYVLGSAYGANVEKDGDQWTLVLVRELKHAPAKVWSALTDPEQLKNWAPFDTDKNLGSAGTHANLTTVGAPQTHVTETVVKRAEAPRVLEYSWGGRDVRWELEPNGSGTRLTLWAGIDKNWIAMGAAGWHLCIDVLDHMLDGDPIGRTVGMDAMKVDGWQRLLGEYSKQFKAS